MQEIRSCLDGEDQVNLWHLRELALTRGGLLSSQLRKRAWPKLAGSHELILLRAFQSTFTSAAANADSSSSETLVVVVEVSDRDMRVLQRDIPETEWNIQHCIYNNRKQRKVTCLPGLTAASPLPVSWPMLPRMKMDARLPWPQHPRSLLNFNSFVPQKNIVPIVKNSKPCKVPWSQCYKSHLKMMGNSITATVALPI